MRKSLVLVMLQVTFWGFIAYGAGSVIYKVGKAFNNMNRTVFAHEEVKK